MTLAAVIQTSAGTDAALNRARAAELVRRAAGAGATLAVLPEYLACYGDPDTRRAAAEDVPGETTRLMGGLAQSLAITIAAGTVMERSSDPVRCFNTCCVFSPQGALAARYRKIHLFDVDLPGAAPVRESEFLLPGTEPVAVVTAAGCLGLAICFDLRFPAHFAALRRLGAEIICIPSAFTFQTGSAHWSTLVRARAIDTQCYVLASNRWGPGEGAPDTWGHSMIVDPWGEVLAECADGEGFCLAEINIDRVASVRQRIPLRPG